MSGTQRSGDETASPKLLVGDVPTGWSANPSTGRERNVAAALAAVNALIALYLIVYQAHWIRAIWDPFFGAGSERVLSFGDRALGGFPDAALGCGAYVLEALLIAIGGRVRWRDHPYVAVACTAWAGLLWLTGLTLFVVQGVVVGAWCTGCLLVGLISAITFRLTIDEGVASGRRLVAEAYGRSEPENAQPPKPAPAWRTVSTLCIGVLLMALPALYGLIHQSRASCLIAGAVTVFGVIAARSALAPYMLALPVAAGGCTCLVAPWAFEAPGAAKIVQLAIGVALIGLGTNFSGLGEQAAPQPTQIES